MATGLDPKYYSPHSLKKGGATDLKKKGVDDSVIRALAGWKSDAHTVGG